jgi:hypothetical protein
MPQLSQFSFLLDLGLLAALLISQTWRWRPVGLLLAGLLRPGAGGASTTETLAGALTRGQPVVEVYSDY